MTQPPPDLPRRAQVVVVGGGVAGVAATWHLARAGVDVVLLEAETVASGATAAAVGVLTPPMRQPFHETVRFYGVEAAREAWAFALRSAEGLADLLEAEGLAGEAQVDRAGGYVVADADGRDELRAACDALVEAGLPVLWLDGHQVAERSGTDAFAGGFRVEGPGALDPVGATTALARLAEDAGARLVEGVRVSAVERKADGLVVHAAGAAVEAEMVVYATHAGSRRFSEFLGDEIVPVLGQALVTRPVEGVGAGGWSTHRGMNSWRTDRDGRVLLTGWRWDSWDRSYWRARPALDDELQDDLLSWLRRTFPHLDPVEVERRWGGVYGWTADGLPLAGPLPGSPRELVVGGFSGAGAAFAFGCGEVVAAVVAGAEPPEGAHLFNPRRHA